MNYTDLKIDPSTGPALAGSYEWLAVVNGWIQGDAVLNVSVSINGYDGIGNPINVQSIANQTLGTDTIQVAEFWAQLTQAGSYSATGVAQSTSLTLCTAEICSPFYEPTITTPTPAIQLNMR